MKINIILITMIFSVTLFMSRCTTFNQPLDSHSSKGLSSISKFTVEIISEPAGVNIEINDNYIGKTPINVELEGWNETRTFARNHIIVAHPIRAGGQTQVKSFIGWSEPSQTYGDKIPNKIYFDMNLVRIK